MFVVIDGIKQKSSSGTLECFPLRLFRKDLKALIIFFIRSVFWNVKF